jgi:hypothetical protein
MQADAVDLGIGFPDLGRRDLRGCIGDAGDCDANAECGSE